ncbi:MAG: glycosyltransferase family 4 protein [Bacteroidaceae bacterium]|nr:glycosyltransferase family 4 protein [Bacteroidaceae bacterium]
MRIGFDAKKAMRNHTGIGNYSRRCIRAVEEAGCESRLFYGRVPVLGEFWRLFLQWMSVAREKIDVYHGLSNELPFGIRWSGVRSVVTVHDLIFLRFPETYGRLARLILRLKTRYACRVCDRIVAVSEMTRRDLIHYYNIPPERIEVIYQSIDDRYRERLPDDRLRECARRYNLPECFFLCVGTIQERKNQHTLVRALSHLPSDVHLVLAGKAEAYVETVKKTAEEEGVADRVHIYSGVPTEDLPAFYQSARAFACLSRFEGFGIPIAEALASGTPVIAAKGSCLEEAGGPDSIYLDPDDYVGLAQHLTAILTDPATAEKMAERGRDYSKRFTDRALGESLVSLYKLLLEE